MEIVPSKMQAAINLLLSLWSAKTMVMQLILQAGTHPLPLRCMGRIVNPVGQLSRGEHVDKVCVIAGHQDMLARDDHGGNHQVSIALPPAMLLAQTFHHGRAGDVKHHDVELGEHLLRVSQPLVCKGRLDRRCLQGKVTPPAQHFGNHDGREGDFCPRNMEEIQA